MLLQSQAADIGLPVKKGRDGSAFDQRRKELYLNNTIRGKCLALHQVAETKRSAKHWLKQAKTGRGLNSLELSSGREENCPKTQDGGIGEGSKWGQGNAGSKVSAQLESLKYR